MHCKGKNYKKPSDYLTKWSKWTDDNDEYNLEVVSTVQSVLIEVGAEHEGAVITLEGADQTGVWRGTKVLQTDDDSDPGRSL